MLPHPPKHGLRIMNSSIFQPLDVDFHQKLKTDCEWFQEKLAYMERRSLSGIMSSGSASSHGPRLEDDLEMAIADEWMEQFMAAENSDESEHDAENSDESEHDEVVKEEVEKDELEMDSDDYEAYIAESVVPEHFQCFEGDKPVLVYDLSSVPNKQLVAELARRLGD